jgi:predicted transcriptional regulator
MTKKVIKTRKYSVRVEEDYLLKLHYVAKYDDRKAAYLIRKSIRKTVNEFEQEHGKILDADLNDIREELGYSDG